MFYLLEVGIKDFNKEMPALGVMVSKWHLMAIVRNLP